MGYPHKDQIYPVHFGILLSVPKAPGRLASGGFLPGRQEQASASLDRDHGLIYTNGILFAVIGRLLWIKKVIPGH